jgi:hypothetical protein
LLTGTDELEAEAVDPELKDMTVLTLLVAVLRYLPTVGATTACFDRLEASSYFVIPRSTSLTVIASNEGSDFRGIDLGSGPLLGALSLAWIALLIS